MEVAPRPRRPWIAYLLAGIVFVVAAAVRLPSCYESLWLDELHSAWAIWGSFAEVASRAAAGNQTPPYFWMLWLWKQCLGDSEWALRLPGVIAISLAAAMLTLGVYRTRGSLWGGIAAGLVLALESNALFYGTEFRPFAAIVFLATGACWLAMKPGVESLQDNLALVAITIAAAIFQPTSIGVLGWLLVARFAFAAFRASAHPQPIKHETGTCRLSRLAAMGLAVIVLAAAAVWLGGDVMRNAWQHRTQWQEMGRADSLRQIWRAWPWGSLVLLPAILMVAMKARANFQRKPAAVEVEASFDRVPWWGLTVSVFAAVLMFWSASALGIAPVFHRRYFVACLPLLAWVTGDLVALTLKHLNSLNFNRASKTAVAIVVATIPVAMLLLTQGTARKLFSQDTKLVRRGEDWRGAVRNLYQHQPRGTQVFLSPGLIETARLLGGPAKEQNRTAQWYLSYPLQGPYFWPNVQAFDLAAKPYRGGFPVVIRGSRAVAENWVARSVDADKDSLSFRSFGGVQVVERLAPVLPNQ